MLIRRTARGMRRWSEHVAWHGFQISVILFRKPARKNSVRENEVKMRYRTGHMRG